MPFNLIKLSVGLFLKFHWLAKLNISHNLIDNVPPDSFIDLSNLYELDLSFNYISSLRPNSLRGLVSLKTLDLSSNKLNTLSKFQLTHLKSIRHLIITKNKIGSVALDAFGTVPTLRFLESDEYRFCCIAEQAERCTPEPDEFSSCEDLMANYALQVRPPLHS